MKTIINTLEIFLVFMGLIAIAGSANDCDGKCVETANTLGEMLMIVFIGFTMMVTGGTILIKNSN